MSGFTHVLTYDGGVLVAQLPGGCDVSTFSNPLHRFNGEDQWGLGLAPLPPDKTYEEMEKAGELSTEYIQAVGLPDAMTVEIRKPGGEQWDAAWVRYTVGKAFKRVDNGDTDSVAYFYSVFSAQTPNPSSTGSDGPTPA
ncbi:hypothetical protein [Mycolicibacterium fortuitum]|uniref:Uncharacterized protein n=1 Tax=Mycolicibacterium fortuitum subsp. fortuitum DSM 46621 = ATCC 6841 = JCM 6387 TaxID=1214102 RepID=K0V3X9_MYCFO|nr:hypothetical protein [Mycolicibacterium fortuitum]AJR30141.1 hypothetical protein G155_16955 [Mycobacterium sp. VKM Ac-1817D]EJZ13716.1 hypothetical protein MFORT_13238 [Mycolicibacterium fortuitum subsp. fortuitum DSM 46621 = ATCC 6841 = JCM 6387]WEV30445.1 hypothetical protein OMF10_17185 [Mycolicibacterium fortuitum]CRL55802.1 hypothetical protein CPGR_03110 [Mycolicibacterium fortuitum subsp. fortuitum DSM 46621 = ATCC 6841 = JCM 6387]BDD99340.1 hypothetical protein MFTT_34340 [Mycolici